MSTATPELTRAAERWMEAYGGPKVLNTYLMMTVIGLVVAVLVMSGLLFHSQNTLASMKPHVIYIDKVGLPEMLGADEYKPKPLETKYLLSRWADLYFGRDRFKIKDNQIESLSFLSGPARSAVIAEEKKYDTIGVYQRNSSLPYVSIDVKNVILDDLETSPYQARIWFERVYTNPETMREIKRDQCTASVTFVFHPTDSPSMVKINPLGLAIVRLTVDQVFD